MLVKIIALVYLNMLKNNHDSIREKVNDEIIIGTFIEKNMPFKIMSPQQYF